MFLDLSWQRYFHWMIYYGSASELIFICFSLLFDVWSSVEIRWTKLYQKPVGGSRSKEMKRQIMVRPSFPPIFCESQMPDVNNITEVVVIVNDVWKVGDLVDWWTDNCYWTGRLTEILGDGKARVIFLHLIYVMYLLRLLNMACSLLFYFMPTLIGCTHVFYDRMLFTILLLLCNNGVLFSYKFFLF